MSQQLTPEEMAHAREVAATIKQPEPTGSGAPDVNKVASDYYARGRRAGREHESGSVRAFHLQVIGLSPADAPALDPDECMRRARLIAEEACETVAALVGGAGAAALFDVMTHRVRKTKPSLVGYCDGAADLRVVLHGTDLQLGVWSVANDVFDLVMDSNDAKAGGPKDPTTGKQLKPEGWQPPDIAGLLRERLGWTE